MAIPPITAPMITGMALLAVWPVEATGDNVALVPPSLVPEGLTETVEAGLGCKIR
jgi:hypothetical protein